MSSAKPAGDRTGPGAGEEPAEDGGGSLWQWLAIGVLVGCWLAEAAWCVEAGF